MTPYFRKLAVMAAAGGAVVALAGAGAATAGTAARPPAMHKVTPSCLTCFSLTTLASFADGQTQQAYIPGTNGHAVPSQGRIGQKIVFRFGDDTNSNQDFRASVAGSVSDFCVTDPPPTSQQFNETGYICLHYTEDPVYEAEWAPLGVGSGLCIGVAVANLNGQNVTLQPCGATNKTMWIADEANAHIGHTPWINGSDTNFSHPLVLALHSNTNRPANQLFVERQNLLNIGFVANNQMFRVHFGPWV